MGSMGDITGGGNNDTRWSNAEYDQLIADATDETDENARQGDVLPLRGDSG